MCCIFTLLPFKSIEIILYLVIFMVEIFEMCCKCKIGSVCQWAKCILFHDYMLFVMERLCANVLFSTCYFSVYFVIE